MVAEAVAAVVAAAEVAAAEEAEEAAAEAEAEAAAEAAAEAEAAEEAAEAAAAAAEAEAEAEAEAAAVVVAEEAAAAAVAAAAEAAAEVAEAEAAAAEAEAEAEVGRRPADREGSLHGQRMRVALIDDRVASGREVHRPGLVACAKDTRRAALRRDARDGVPDEVEVVHVRVVVELERVRALGQRPAVQIMTVGILQTRSRNQARQRRSGQVGRTAGCRLPRRVGLPDPEDVGPRSPAPPRRRGRRSPLRTSTGS